MNEHDNHRLTLGHEYLCTACAHRDHRNCERDCDYCQVSCQCMCRRWAIPVPDDDQ